MSEPLPSYAEAYTQGLKEGIEKGVASQRLVILDLEKEVNRLKTVLGTFRVLVDSYESPPTTYVRHDHDQDETPARGSAPGDPEQVGPAGGSDPGHEHPGPGDPEAEEDDQEEDDQEG